MEKIRIMLMSGYLGSGKTTSMTSLAEYFKENGKKVCLITNDLGSNLVDTAYVKNHDIPVLEIPDGCLCHDVPQLMEKIAAHVENDAPDFVIFEPVGSCVDMVDHVYRDENLRSKYTLAPVSAIVDPIRYREVYITGMRCETKGERSVAYGFKKQLEEADVLLLNKIDMLSEDEKAEIRANIAENFPDVPVIEISGLNGINMDQWADYVMNNESMYRALDIDMNIIMSGCEEMGWYNKVCQVKSAEPVDAKKLCEEYLEEIKAAFKSEDREILHAKVNLNAGNFFCKSAITTTKGNIQTAGPLKSFAGEGTLNVNIRALMMPKPLAMLMEGKLVEILEKYGMTLSENQLQSFLPVEMPPVPTAEYK